MCIVENVYWETIKLFEIEKIEKSNTLQIYLEIWAKIIDAIL